MIDRLLRLEWKVVRRLDGRLRAGTAPPPRGSRLHRVAAYGDGDDARHIDWNVTARLDEPHLREFTEDRELTVWLVLDRSASMAAGGPGAASTTCSPSSRSSSPGCSAGAATASAPCCSTPGARASCRPAPPAARAADRRELERAPDSRAAATTDLAAMLDAAASRAAAPHRRAVGLHRRRRLGTLAAAPGPAARGGRPADRGPADDVLPEAGLIVVEDAETGEQLVVDSADPLLRVRFRAAVDARDARLRRACAGPGCPSTASTPTATWPRRSSRSSPEPGGLPPDEASGPIPAARSGPCRPAGRRRADSSAPCCGRRRWHGGLAAAGVSAAGRRPRSPGRGSPGGGRYCSRSPPPARRPRAGPADRGHRHPRPRRLQQHGRRRRRAHPAGGRAAGGPRVRGGAARQRRHRRRRVRTGRAHHGAARRRPLRGWGRSIV